MLFVCSKVPLSLTYDARHKVTCMDIDEQKKKLLTVGTDKIIKVSIVQPSLSVYFLKKERLSHQIEANDCFVTGYLVGIMLKPWSIIHTTRSHKFSVKNLVEICIFIIRAHACGYLWFSVCS